MTEEENPPSVIEEAVAQPSETEQVQDAPPAEVKEQPQRQISDEEHNWREARRKLETLERSNYELQAKIESMSRPKVEEDDLSKIADDDIVTAKQAKQLAHKMAQQVAQDAIRQREAQTLDDRLQAKFPDFNQVVSRENIELLKMQEPELAMSLYALSNDPYAQSVAAYKMIKKQGLGVSEEVARNKQKAIENSKKPVSVQTVTKSSAIGNAHSFENGLTPELKKQLQREMSEAAKRL